MGLFLGAGRLGLAHTNLKYRVLKDKWGARWSAGLRVGCGGCYVGHSQDAGRVILQGHMPLALAT